MITFSKAAWLSAQEAWRSGRFGAEWDPFRTAAAERGFIFPPGGSPDDDPEDPHPSQRAVVYEAVSNTPRALMDAIAASRDWSEVVRLVIASRRILRRAAVSREQEPTPGISRDEAAEIVQRIEAGTAGYHHGGS